MSNITMNHFERKYASKSNKELEQIASNGDFDKNARSAARQILISRDSNYKKEFKHKVENKTKPSSNKVEFDSNELNRIEKRLKSIERYHSIDTQIHKNGNTLKITRISNATYICRLQWQYQFIKPYPIVIINYNKDKRMDFYSFFNPFLFVLLLSAFLVFLIVQDNEWLNGILLATVLFMIVQLLSFRFTRLAILRGIKAWISK